MSLQQCRKMIISARGATFPYTLTLLFLCSGPLFPTFSPSFSNARSLFSLRSPPSLFLQSHSCPYDLNAHNLSPTMHVLATLLFPTLSPTLPDAPVPSFFFHSYPLFPTVSTRAQFSQHTVLFSPTFSPFPYTLNLFSYCSYFLFPVAFIRLSLN